MVERSVTLSNVPAQAPAEALPEGRRSLITFGLAFGLAVTNAYLLISKHQPLTPYGLFVASAILWVCAIPLWLFLVGGRRSLGFTAVACGLYAVYFASPAFSPRPLFRLSKFEPAWSSVEVALTVGLVGVVALVAGICGSRIVVARLPRVRREIDFDRALPPLLIASLVGFVVHLLTRQGTNVRFTSILVALQDIGMLALGGLLVAWLRNRLVWWQKVYFIAVMLGISAVGLASGALAEIAFPMSGLAFLYCWERRRLPLGALLAGALILAPFQVSKFAYRETIRSPNTTIVETPSLTKRLTDFLTITVDMIKEGRIQTDDVVDAHEGRLDMLSIMSIVVEATPESVPYWDGYTYSDLIWHVVPRVLVPDKPALSMGQEFPRRYALIQWFDTETSYNLSQIVEFYINFGWIGVLLGMFLIGTLYAMVEHVCSASTGGALIGASLLSGLMNVESNFAIVWGGIPFRFLAFYAFIRLLPPLKPELTTGTSPP
jgi:hypothetical protein